MNALHAAASAAAAAAAAAAAVVHGIPQGLKQHVETCGVQSGAIMNRSFQPHESHVPFLLQFKASSPPAHTSPESLLSCCLSGHISMQP